MNIEGLKEQARRHEQKEEWRKALELYQKALDRLAEEDQPDVSLYNRVGDLCVRVGDLDRATKHYEQAVDLYVEAELPNNAIAVCKKIIRNVPSRHSVYLRMGRIRAQQGFLTDARQNFLTYAERVQAAGDLKEALRALEELAQLFPEDAEIHLSLAARLQQHGRPEDAIAQLEVAYRVLEARGDAAGAAAVEAKAKEIDPAVDFSSEPATDQEPSQPEDDGGAFELGSAIGGEGEPEPKVAEVALEPREAIEAAAALADAGPGLAIERHNELAAGEAAEQEVEPEWGGFSIDPVEPGAAPGEEDEEEEEVTPLPTLFLPDEAEGAATDFAIGFGEIELPGAEEEPAAEEEGEPLPLLTDWQPEPLPLLGEEPAGAPETVEPALGGVEAGDLEVTFSLDTPALEGAPAEALARAVEDAAADLRAEPTPEELIAAGELAAAERLIRERMEADLLELSHRLRLVEVAYRKGDPHAQAEAYVELARCLERQGSSAQAASVYQQVLQLDPENAEARAALAASAPGVVAEATPVASSEDYVDLGSLIFGDEPEEKTTRFLVEYEEPTGDEQADFARMLSQFKAKIAENVAPDDLRAHHDLGTAYKEMGLWSEAIEEFQAALRASRDHLPTYELLGQCFLEKGEPEAAIRSLKRGMALQIEVEDELLGIYYFLGRAYEQIGDRASALEYYDRVFSLDINFMDVTERLRALR